MNLPGTTILNKILAIEFFRRNASLFLLIILFAAGFMRGIDHLFLATYFTSSLQLLSIPIFIWTIYLSYVIHSNYRILKYPENTFVNSFLLLPAREQWGAAMSASGLQLLPSIAYGTFLVVISLKNETYLTAIVTVLVLLCHFFGAAFLLNKKLLRPDFEQRAGVLSHWISNNVIRPFSAFCLEWSLRRQPLQIIGFKLFGFALLRATLYLYKTDSYDLRLAGLGVLFAFALNTAFIFGAHEFITKHFPLFRQMPFSLFKRWIYIILILALFTLPELVVLIRYLPTSLHLAQGVLLYTFGLSVNILMLHLLFIRINAAEKSMPGVYILIVLTFFAVLGGIHLGALAVVNAAGSFILMRRFYYRYENA